MEFYKPEIRRILLATDLSETADRAFGYAAAMADAHEAGIAILLVLEKLPPESEWMAVLLQEAESMDDLEKKSESEILQRVKSYIEHYCTEFNGRFPACRLMVEAVTVERGDPAKRILHHAHTGGYDLLVMGSRGQGLIREILMGSTSQSIVRECRIPVFIVPPDDK